MYKPFILSAAFGVVSLPAQAVTFDLLGTVVNGPAAGATATAYLVTTDKVLTCDSCYVAPDDDGGRVGGMTLSFAFLGQQFWTEDATEYPWYIQARFEDGIMTQLWWDVAEVYLNDSWGMLTSRQSTRPT